MNIRKIKRTQCAFVLYFILISFRIVGKESVDTQHINGATSFIPMFCLKLRLSSLISAVAAINKTVCFSNIKVIICNTNYFHSIVAPIFSIILILFVYMDTIMIGFAYTLHYMCILWMHTYTGHSNTSHNYISINFVTTKMKLSHLYSRVFRQKGIWIHLLHNMYR